MSNNSNNDTNQTGVLKGEEKLLLSHNYDGIQELDHMLPRWWVWIFFATVIFSVGYVGYYMTGVGPSSREELAADLSKLAEKKSSSNPGTPGENTEDAWLVALQDPQKIESGKAVYAARCMPCHADKGQGLIGPNLTDNHWVHGAGKITDIAQVIIKGVPEKGMPPWEMILTPEEMKNLVAFVFTLKGTNVQGGKAPEGNPVE